MLATINFWLAAKSKIRINPVLPTVKRKSSCQRLVCLARCINQSDEQLSATASDSIPWPPRNEQAAKNTGPTNDNNI